MKRAKSILVLSSITSTGLFFAKAQSQELGYYHPNYLAVKVDKEGYVTLSGNFRKIRQGIAVPPN